MPNQLIEKYYTTINQIVEAFSKKQGLVFKTWVRGNVGGVAIFEGKLKSYDFSDIVYDLETKQNVGFIDIWKTACWHRSGSSLGYSYPYYCSQYGQKIKLEKEYALLQWQTPKIVKN